MLYWRVVSLLNVLVLCAVILTGEVIYPITRYLPDTSGIDGQLLTNLHIDDFFSLWVVFHNEGIKRSNETFTIFAPVNRFHTNSTYLKNPEFVKKLILNHVVLGSKLDIKNISDEYNVTTIGGETITLLRKNDKFFVNKALVLEPKVEVQNGVMIVIDNYLFGLDDNFKKQDEILPAGLLTTVTVTDEKKINTSVADNSKFIENIHQVLSFLKNGVRVFQHFLSKSNVSRSLNNGQEYTVLVPTDHAFQRWHPIDWGFYPFSVPEFTEDILRNHFIIGNLRQNDIKNEQQVQTLGGRILKFSLKPTLTVNDVYIIKGDTPVNGGNIMFINEVLFVNESVVSRLHQQHRDKETPPLLAFPWFGAQFLSHAFLALERDRRFSHITRFLNLADLAPHVSGTGYTFFVPVDDAFDSIGLSTMPDNYLSTGNGLKLLLNHFVKKRLYERDLINKATFKTLGNETITIYRQDNQITINDAHIIESEVFVYNLGTMYYIDKLLFAEPKTILNSKIPIITPVLNSTTVSTQSEPVPEELMEESGMLPDVLLESSTEEDKETNTFEVPVVISNNSSNEPIK